MKNFSTNWYLYNTLNSKNKPKQITIPELHSKDVRKKLDKINKAFK